MKIKIFAVLLMTTMTFACNQKKETENQTDIDTTTTATEATTDTMASDTAAETEKFACSMHPEVIGNKGEKCSKCNMDLTVPVTN